MTDRDKLEFRRKRLVRILSELRQCWLFVEGKKDKAALGQLGCAKVRTISGNLRRACEGLGADAGKVIVLTDMDRRGEQLMKAAKAELEACSQEADTDTRKRLADILRLRFFEDAARKHAEFMESVEEYESRNKKR